MDHYERLEVSRTASVKTINAAFRALSTIYHPDVQGTGDGEVFRAMSEAHETLADKDKRAAYDAMLKLTEENGRRGVYGQAPQAVAQGPSEELRNSVSLLFTLGNTWLGQVDGLHPMVNHVAQQVQPDLEKLAAACDW